MAGTVVSDLTDISLCEAVGSWSGTPTPTLQDPLVFTAKQGTYCMQSYSASAVTRSGRWDFGATSGYWKDFTGKFFYMWMAFSMKDYSASAGTIKLRLTDGAGKNRDWYIFDKTTLPHIGWICWVVHAEYGYDASDSGFDLTQIRYAGFFTTDTLKGKAYVYWDAVRFGTGLSIKGGTSGDSAIWENFYTDEGTYAYGVVDKRGGVYFIKGQIGIGSMTVDESTYFKDLNQVVIFEDIKGTPSGVYEIKGKRAGSGSGTTKIFFGTSGISGCFIRASTSMKFKFTMTDSGITEFGFHACLFVNADTISFPVYSANKEVRNSSFIGCAKVSSSTTMMISCNFVSSPAIAVTYSTYLTYCNFIGCAVGIEIVDSQTFVGLVFTNCTYDVKKTTGDAGVVTNTFSSNAGTYDPAGSVVTFITSVTLRLSHLIQNSEVVIVTHGTTTEEAHVENVTDYNATDGYYFDYPFNWTANHYVDIFITKNDYEWFSMMNYLLLNVNTTLPISQRKDRVYANP